MGKSRRSNKRGGFEHEKLLVDGLVIGDFDLDADACWEDDILGRYEEERWNVAPERKRRKWRWAAKADRDDEYFEDRYFERGA